MRGTFVFLATAAAALLLAGCAGTPLAPAAGSPPAVAEVPAPLAAEQHWLAQLFEGTPVTVGATDQGAVRVEVPLKYAFDPGRPAIKPPLNAVLDKVAASLARQKHARLQLAAPAERGDSVRSAMLARGIPPARIDRLPPRSDAVELRLFAPAAIERLDDPPATVRR